MVVSSTTHGVMLGAGWGAFRTADCMVRGSWPSEWGINDAVLGMRARDRALLMAQQAGKLGLRAGGLTLTYSVVAGLVDMARGRQESDGLSVGAGAFAVSLLFAEGPVWARLTSSLAIGVTAGAIRHVATGRGVGSAFTT